ncbi:MAG: hypothetical protein HY900_01980 [Deltaproteobacteria bacterium]|nr:hypothetical protein [Deltaproteobacteria bacterium]
MTYSDQWRALSSRIRGLMKAGQLHASYLSIRASDGHGRAKRLREQCESVLSGLLLFRDHFRNALPPPALEAIHDFLERTGALIRDGSGPPNALEERVWAALVLLAAFETELSFILSDAQEAIRARSERAFAHLQRLIVVDPAFREKWQIAFQEGEVACEGLGAVHLLLHGIWAFKVGAAGARTDLVFQEPSGDLAEEQGFVDGFVLTEWKKAGSEAEAQKRFGEARSQADQYAAGVLAGSELRGYRYAIVVSGRQVQVPEDVIEGGVMYRHINVAVEPVVPSRTR